MQWTWTEKLNLVPRKWADAKIFSDVFVDISEKLRIICFCMDKKKVCKIPECGAEQKPAGGRIVVGSKQLRKALRAGTVRQVFLAENADPAVTDPLEELCGELHIQITWIRTMAELGQACGIEVGAAAAAVLNS